MPIKRMTKHKMINRIAWKVKRIQMYKILEKPKLLKIKLDENLKQFKKKYRETLCWLLPKELIWRHRKIRLRLSLSLNSSVTTQAGKGSFRTINLRGWYLSWCFWQRSMALIYPCLQSGNSSCSMPITPNIPILIGKINLRFILVSSPAPF